MIRTTLLAGLMLAATAAPALAQSRWDLGGGRPGDRDYRLMGRGVPLLYPELRATNRGRAFVMRNFDRNRDGYVSVREAQEANSAFRDIAGPRRDRFDWALVDPRPPEPRPLLRVPPPVPPLAQPRPAPRRDMRGMRDYSFRQTPRGAAVSLSDEVLFRTDSADLRPEAIGTLRPLADYLRDNPGVRVAIDGHTDSRGTDEYNQALSERRAESVRAAFDELGVTRARFTVEGHGESMPVASNATPEGMQQNRRVEITLLGQRAETFRDAD